MRTETTNYRADIGRQLAELRAKRGLTTRQLADACGVNYANISKIERGSYNVSVDILGRVCEALGAELRIVEKTKRNPRTSNVVRGYGIHGWGNQ